MTVLTQLELEFYFYYLCVAIVVPYMFYVAIDLSQSKLYGLWGLFKSIN